ncbi:prolyl hydroxylase EGLN3 isoform X1 [Cloeon dipterum]|uniref:prolyl hydroxylase EGLN3 isoform X1 n=1 Tax=Cloeon dipterum TaxID=197152 RepID=UPI00321FDA7D
MNPAAACELCGSREKLLRCSRCRKVWYCSKEHQREHWKKHKRACVPRSNVSGPTPEEPQTGLTLVDSGISELNINVNPFPCEGSSEIEILNAVAEVLSPVFLDSLTGQYLTEPSSQEMPDLDTMGKVPHTDNHPPFLHSRSSRDQRGIIEEICKTVIKDMEDYGICVVDNFLGLTKGSEVEREVLSMYNQGVFKDGQLVSSRQSRGDLKTIRSDEITWIDGKEPSCSAIGHLISRVDAVILKANQMSTSGKLSRHTITGRTKAMVACYPGHGTGYVKHVDNPNRDGRIITAIYYLNKDWNIKDDGGLLRIFPDWSDHVADIEPVFDRILFFWSDRRNPHEVQPAFRTRYAITLWYFDAVEREEACRRYKNECRASIHPNNSSSSRAVKRPAASLGSASSQKRRQCVVFTGNSDTLLHSSCRAH